MFIEKDSDLPFILHFWVPLLLVLSPYALQAAFGRAGWLTGEGGVFELLTFVLLIAAAGFILRARLYASTLHIDWLPAWLIVLLVGTVYFVGEEISWGQHFFSWETPDAWRDVNDQQETNLHNVHALFDQLPRALLTLAALVGGVLVPFYRHLRGIKEPANKFSGWLWPTGVCVPVCILVLTISPLDGLVERMAEKPGSTMPAWLDINGGEMKECLLALFVLFYAMSLYRRLKALRLKVL